MCPNVQLIYCRTMMNCKQHLGPETDILSFAHDGQDEKT